MKLFIESIEHSFSFTSNPFRLLGPVSRNNRQSNVVVAEAKVDVILALEALHGPISCVSAV